MCPSTRVTPVQVCISLSLSLARSLTRSLTLSLSHALTLSRRGTGRAACPARDRSYITCLSCAHNLYVLRGAGRGAWCGTGASRAARAAATRSATWLCEKWRGPGQVAPHGANHTPLFVPDVPPEPIPLVCRLQGLGVTPSRSPTPLTPGPPYPTGAVQARRERRGQQRRGAGRGFVKNVQWL